MSAQLVLRGGWTIRQLDRQIQSQFYERTALSRDKAALLGEGELREVQKGKDPSDWKPMLSVGLGVREIRIHADEEFRIRYVAKFAEARAPCL